MHTTVVIKPVLDIQAVKAPSYQDSGYISLIFHSDGLLFLTVRNAGDDKGNASGGNGSEIEFATKGTYSKVEAGDISSKGGDADVKSSRSWARGRNWGIAKSGQATAGSGGNITIG
ncbi:hypothetical protein EMGR_004155 [Emarellia grisea]